MIYCITRLPAPHRECGPSVAQAPHHANIPPPPPPTAADARRCLRFRKRKVRVGERSLLKTVSSLQLCPATPHARSSPRQQDWGIPAGDRAAPSSDQEHICIGSQRCFFSCRYSKTISDQKSVVPCPYSLLASSEEPLDQIRASYATSFQQSDVCTHGAVSHRPPA